MKIREIKCAGLRGATPEGGWSNEIRPDDCVHTLIAVHTDEGLVGLGSVFTNDALVQAALNLLEPLYRGENALEPERVSEKLHQNMFWMGRGGSITHAISGIDIALWDILGKSLGVPCSKLWGGPVRDHIRTYCHLGGGKMEDFYETASEDANRFADLALQAVEDGFTAFKSMAVPPTLPLEGRKPIRTAEACVAAMREAVGDSIDIMVDCHARPSPAMGMQFAKALEPYGLYFLEEPCWPESVEGLAAINSSVSTPIATGERVTNLAAFRDLFAARACEICQLDITHCGGLSEARRIAALAEAYRISLAPHNPQGPVSTAASLEFGFSQPSYIICETVHNDVPWRQDVVEEGFITERKGRIVKPNTRPGLGIKINEGELKKHPFQQELPQRVFYTDGSVGDW
ncbi:MAG: mandelate racemase/muconate lactonizing enzyme family protein [Planctomycetota bacterium]